MTLQFLLKNVLALFLGWCALWLIYLGIDDWIWFLISAAICIRLPDR